MYQFFCDGTKTINLKQRLVLSKELMCMRAARIEQGSALMLADVSATNAVGAFLCSCFRSEVMSYHIAIEKKFQ